MSSKRGSADDVIDLTFDSDDEQDLVPRNSANNSGTNSTTKNKRFKATHASKAVSANEFEIITLDSDDDLDMKLAAKPSKRMPLTSSEDGVEFVDSCVACPTVAAANNAPAIDGDLEVVGTRNEFKLPHLRQHCTVHSFIAKNRNDSRAQNAKHCELCYCYVCDAPVKECKYWTSTESAWHKSHCNATNEYDSWIRQRERAKRGDNSSSGCNRTPPGLVSAPVPTVTPVPTVPRTPFPTESSFPPGQLPQDCSAAYTQCPHCKWHNHLLYIKTKGHRCLKCGRYASGPRDQATRLFSPKEGSHILGKRELRFGIVACDVRSISRFRESWERANKKDPLWQYNDAAMKKSFFDFRIGKHPRLKSIISMTSEYDEKTTCKRVKKRQLPDCITMEDINDITLLRIIFDRDMGPSSGISYDVTASWDETNSVGSFLIRLAIPNSSMDEELIGCWFKVFPFNLLSISGTLKASDRMSYRTSSSERSIEKSMISKHNEKADALRSSLAFLSSTGNPDNGGFTDTDISFRGILEKFYRESFAYLDFSFSWGEEPAGWNKISNHKKDTGYTREDVLLSYQDRQFAMKFLPSKMGQKESMESVLVDLENLGHETELTCDGLEVELLEFQKQSLKWAMERETTIGGIQSYFWPKVPLNGGSSVYFNPILQRFSKSKPKEVRGGIIADEMGLGKTVISLALILKNPAPLLPQSGDKISALSKYEVASNSPLQWNKVLYGQTSSDNPQRGSILSRGTLVICPVSLVGQWMREARSKLSDPGLLYPYHGGCRNRDPVALSKNAIVVTTYQILASDDTYHRKKSSHPDRYCPPLEQVRWWRVICDEGHQLRQANTNRNRSLVRLVADNKWLVTGTPVSTSLKDLINQLKLLGIEYVEQMIGKYSSSQGSRNFLLRNLMIRHTQKQCYRLTNTALMHLPAKKERSIEVSLPMEERKEYDALDKAAKAWYVHFKAAHRGKMSSNYLLLSQKLNPQRVACSGGRPPLNPDAECINGKEYSGNNFVKVQKKSEIKFSSFCFTAKLNILIKELKKARENDQASKSLVFSQFNSTLEWLQEELPKRGFKFRTLSGSMSMQQRAKALHDFQADPPTTIFLLSMRAGNCGINLTQANRVFLMEPGFNPALEKQAIGRVHRLGQKRQVEVIRLLVKDSIETRICKFLKTKYGASSNVDSEEESKKGTKEGPAEITVVKSVGNLASERPANEMVTSEFDMLFGIESGSEIFDSAMLNPATMSDML